MITLEDLYAAYLHTRANKRRSADSVAFELHWERNLFNLLEAINTRTLKPTAYTFITSHPRHREVFACSMEMRIVHHYIDIRLRPLLEARMTRRTFNNRVGMGQNVAINQLIEDIYDVSHGFTTDAWIIKLDLRGYFPNANQDITFNLLREVVETDYHKADREDLLYLIERSIYAFPQRHCYRKSSPHMWQYIEKGKSLFEKPDGIGGAIGHLIWQNTMNYYLDDIDHWLVDELQLRYCRFVDDMVFVTDNKDAFLAYVIPLLREKLKAKGCEMHPQKFYCQHYTKGVEFIGSHIKMDRVYGNSRCLRNAMTRIHQLNKAICPANIDSAIASFNSYLGLFKTRNGYNQCMKIIRAIFPRWERYLEYDPRNIKVVAKEGFKRSQRLRKKYHIHAKE